MHSTGIEVPGWHQVTLHHNGDWSGKVLINAWLNDGEATDDPDLDIEISDDHVVQKVKRSGPQKNRVHIIPLAKIIALIYCAGLESGRAMLGNLVTQVIEQGECGACMEPKVRRSGR